RHAPPRRGIAAIVAGLVAAGGAIGERVGIGGLAIAGGAGIGIHGAILTRIGSVRPSGARPFQEFPLVVDRSLEYLSFDIVSISNDRPGMTVFAVGRRRCLCIMSADIVGCGSVDFTR